jgi:hypothetical protein
MAEQRKSECIANSYFIINYSNSLNKRLNGNKSLLIRDYLIIILYYILSLKFSMILFIEFGYETRLILFDVSLFIGGIEKYNTFILIMACLLGAYLHKLLYLVSPTDLVWSKLLDLNEKEIPHSMDRREIVINKKVFSRSRIIYKIIDLTIVCFGELLFLNYFLNTLFLNSNLSNFLMFNKKNQMHY